MPDVEDCVEYVGLLEQLELLVSVLQLIVNALLLSLYLRQLLHCHWLFRGQVTLITSLSLAVLKVR